MDALNLPLTSLRIGLIYNPLGGLARKHRHVISTILAELPKVSQWQISTGDDFDSAVNALIQTKLNGSLLLVAMELFKVFLRVSFQGCHLTDGLSFRLSLVERPT